MSKSDILIGIPSLNEADNIAFVAYQIGLGLKKYFPDHIATIINVDNNSQDRTKDAFLNAFTGDIPKKYISTGEGVVGKGNNMRNLFSEVETHDAKVIAVVDADLRSITPEWVKNLITPILKGYDFVTPLYSRNEYDGTITNHICYPLIYGLFGADIRQPIGGEFAFSPKMANYWLDMKWKEDTRQYGIDIFMTTAALLNGFNVCQVALGSKVHKPSAPKLGPMFTQVVTTLFNNLSKFKNIWMNGNGYKECPVFGHLRFEKPQGLSVDYKDIKEKSFEGFKKNEKLLTQILSTCNFEKLKKMSANKKWDIGSEFWSKILYDFVFAYATSDRKKKVVEALKPLYFAKTASFYRQTMDMNHEDAEKKILNEARQFQKTKKYLLRKFNTPEINACSHTKSQ